MQKWLENCSLDVEERSLLPDGELGESFEQVDVGSVLVRGAQVRQFLDELIAHTLLFQQVHEQVVQVLRATGSVSNTSSIRNETNNRVTNIQKKKQL